jgi:hypothetical protein
MENYQHLRVDAEDLILALDSRLDEGVYLVDLDSGEVILSGSEEATGMPEDEEWEDPERFLVVHPIDSPEAFRMMEAFVEDLPEGEPCRALARALRMRGPFRAFKDTLLEFLDLREQWFRFQEGRMLEYAQGWLEESLPGATLVMPPRLRKEGAGPKGGA